MHPLALALMILACRTTPPPVAARPPSGSFEAEPDARSWYLKAVAAEVAGDPEEAKRALDWVARLDRRSPWPWVAQGRLAERVGGLEVADAAYTKAIELHPVPEAHLGRGRVSLARHKPALAVPDLTVAADAGLDEATALLIDALAAVGEQAASQNRLSSWAPMDAAHRLLRAERLAPVDPMSATDAWLVVVDVAQPDVTHVGRLVKVAVAACRSEDARNWLTRRHVAEWGPEWRALVREARSDAPGCATDSP